MGERHETEALQAEVLQLRARLQTLEAAERQRSTTARELERAKRTYQNLVENINDVLFTLDLQGQITYISPVISQLLSLSPAEMVDKPFARYFHPEDRPLLGRALERSSGGKMSIQEIRLVAGSGPTRHVRISERVLIEQGLPVGVIGLITDITKQKQAELEIKEQESRLRAIVDAFEGMIFICDSDRRLTFMNQRLVDRLGRHAIGEPCYQVVHGLDRPCDNCRQGTSNVDQVIRQERLSPLDNHWYYCVEGPVHHIDGSSSRQVMMMDINDLKMTEEALIREKERLDVTLGSIGDGVISTDVHGSITLFNREAERLTGVNPIHAVGRPLQRIYQTLDEKSRTATVDPVSVAIESGQVVHLSTPSLLVAADGRERLVEETAAPIFDHQGRMIGAVLAFRDVTEKRAMEGELIKSQKLESLSFIAGGIAHEFNNHLGVILGTLSLARSEPALSPQLARIFDEAGKAGRRAQSLTEQLLTFARVAQPLVTHTTSVGNLVTRAAEQAAQGTSCVVQCLMPDDLWPVRVDEEQISQVVHNLVINAVQAMPSGGVITVVGANLEIGSDQQVALPPGRYIQVDIRDQGAGIPPELLDRIFEPFFTTRLGARGLGLAIAYAILKNHNGHITLMSQEHQGATVQFLLPSPSRPAEEASRRPPSQPSARPERRLLLLEDEEELRLVATMMLESLGYRVDPVSDGEEAVSCYAQALRAGRPHDAVLADLTITGGVGGKEAVRRMMELDPQLRAIVSSGYSLDPVMRNFRKFGFGAAVAKPYQLQDLERALSQVFDEQTER